MAQIPANQKLWNMYVAQAKARYHVWPSPTAAKWVHDHYTQSGGKFVASEKDVDERFKVKKDKREGSTNPRTLVKKKKNKDKD